MGIMADRPPWASSVKEKQPDRGQTTPSVDAAAQLGLQTAAADVK